MIRFNINDLHEWTISQDRFKEIINTYGFKIDESKHNIQALYNQSLQATAQNIEKSFSFTKYEPTNDGNSILYIKDKDFNEQVFNAILAIEALEVLRKEAMDIFLQQEEDKLLEAIYREYSGNLEEEKQKAMIAAQTLMEHNFKSEQDRQMVLNDYLQNMQNRLNLLKAEANAIKERVGQLKQQKEEAINHYGAQAAKEMGAIKNKNGEPLFDNYSTAQKEKFATEFLKGASNIENNARKEINSLEKEKAVITQRKAEIKAEMKGERTKSVFEPSTNGNVIALSFSGRKKTGRLEQELATLEDKDVQITKKLQDVHTRKKEELTQVTKSAAQAANMTDLFDNISPEELASRMLDLNAIDKGLEVVGKVDVQVEENMDRLDDIREEADKNYAVSKDLVQTGGLSDLSNLEDDLLSLQGDFGDFLCGLEDDLGISPKLNETTTRLK
tara:strand:- start:18827 stop:20158 length:1332 start_codon:yes stop_codon:yes gene_type:complete